MPDFSRRSTEPELMDDLSIGGDELRRTLDELVVINRLLGGHKTSIQGIAQIVPRDCREFTLLDVGAGCGDLARSLSQWGKRRGIRVRVLGIDLAETTVEHARLRSRGFEGLDYRQQDLFLLDPAEQFDIVHAGMVLHHCPEGLAAKFLHKMYAQSRWGIVVNDLHRHPLAYHSIRCLTRLFSRSRLVRHDAAVSVARAFRRADLLRLAAEAALPDPQIVWRWAFRWQMVIRKRQ